MDAVSLSYRHRIFTKNSTNKAVLKINSHNNDSRFVNFPKELVNNILYSIFYIQFYILIFQSIFIRVCLFVVFPEKHVLKIILKAVTESNSLQRQLSINLQYLQ